jgi:TPR repeat protein
MYQVATLMHAAKSFREAARWHSLLVEADDGWSMASEAQVLLKSGQLQEAERLERRALETGYSLNPPIKLMNLLRTTGRADESGQLHAFGIEPGGRTAAPW